MPLWPGSCFVMLKSLEVDRLKVLCSRDLMFEIWIGLLMSRDLWIMELFMDTSGTQSLGI